MKQVSFCEVNQMKQNGDKILIEFFSAGCGPCLILLPILESMESDFPTITFVKVDSNSDVLESARFGVRTIPTVLILDGENVVSKSTGINSGAFYRDILNGLQ
jgi:thiol-disulfide isomerase/thioredoxin